MRLTCLLVSLISAVFVLPTSALEPLHEPARYVVQKADGSPTHLRITGVLPIADGRLQMANSWPGDSEPLASGGWPELVRNLRVRAHNGKLCTVTREGSKGWQLSTPCLGPVRVDYDVEYAALAAQSWPAPREAAYEDDNAFTATGRSAFITTTAMKGASVRFKLPSAWQAAAPWKRTSGSSYVASSTPDLTDNLFAIVRGQVHARRIGTHEVSVIAFGPWLAHRDEALRIAGSALTRFSALMPSGGPRRYLMVLLPQNERGAESLRASFALNARDLNDSGQHGAWRNMIAHEIFHAWNGWQLRGADYASSQWFQEGFTEYMANRTLLDAGIETTDKFVARMREHNANAQKLQTPLDKPGTRKGSPLYSAGALVALDWDARIRRDTGGRQTLDALWRQLWTTASDRRSSYAWSNLREALKAVAPSEDWDSVHARNVAGMERISSDRLDDAVRTVTGISYEP